jgi:hypothetical protein
MLHICVYSKAPAAGVSSDSGDTVAKANLSSPPHLHPFDFFGRHWITKQGLFPKSLFIEFPFEA